MPCLIHASNIKKQYSTRTILDFKEFTLHEGDFVGIVGANGVGKSTLLGILSGEIAADSGTIKRYATPAYIRQLAQNDPTLSGGENVKQRIRESLEQTNGLLFADEPTANLDQSGIEWVKKQLSHAKSIMLVSHDRDLLDTVCNRIVEVKNGELHFYTGNYTDYEEQVRQKDAIYQTEYQNYCLKKQQLKEALQTSRNKASKMRRAPPRMGNSEARLIKGTIKSKQQKVERNVKILQKRMERLPVVESKRKTPTISIDFERTAPPTNKYVIVGKDISFAYGQNIIFENASFSIPRGAKIAIRGNNGAGKTTLLQLIYTGHPAIQCVPKLRLGYLRQGYENLLPEQSILENAMLDAVQSPAVVRGILAGLLFRGDSIDKPASVLSGGERVRLSFAKLVAGAYNALLLDEPTNFLDLEGIRAVQEILAQYPGTLLLVSHDSRFSQALATDTLTVANGAITQESLQPQKAKTNSNKMLLELRRLQIISALSDATDEKKEALEQELDEIYRQLGLARH